MIRYMHCTFRTVLAATGFMAAATAFGQMPEMKNVATNAQLVINRLGDDEITVAVTNPDKAARVDAPVCIALPAGTPYRSATVTMEGQEISSQMDDLDGDGTMDELAFVIDLKKRATATVGIRFSRDEAKPDRYPARVHAQMFFRDRDKKHRVKQHIPTDTVSEVVDNMYSNMHHHGPAFESELVAYRVYFDKKQSTDLYGKQQRQLELADGLWYNDTTVLDVACDLRRDRAFGDDIIRVAQTVSIGGLRGWAEGEPEALVMLDPFVWRQAHVVAKGPVRTVVDMNVQAWHYGGRDLDVKSRYILYAGQRECEVIHQFVGDTHDLEFATGVMVVGTLPPSRDAAPEGTPSYQSDRRGTCASYGRDWPDGNARLYPSQATAALAVCVPEEYVTRYVELPAEAGDVPGQLVYGLRTDRANALRYRMAFAAPDLERFSGLGSAKAWFRWVDEWKETRPVRVEIR